jgi:hypothetical protein
MGNCLVKTFKEEVNNPNLPILTPYGPQQQNVGNWINRLLELGGTPTTEEITALTNLINAFEESGIKDAIAYFYPLLENPNIPLIGTKELSFTNIVPTNANLDFNDDKLRGIKKMVLSSNITYADLFPTDYGVMFGGSMLQSTVGGSELFKLLNVGTDDLHAVCLAIYTNSSGNSRFEIRQFNTDQIASLSFIPNLELSADGDNLFFANGLGNEDTNNMFSGTIVKNSSVLANNAERGATAPYIHDSVISDAYCVRGTGTSSASLSSITTLATFNKILNKTEGKAFVDAVKAFCETTGKTLVV